MVEATKRLWVVCEARLVWRLASIARPPRGQNLALFTPQKDLEDTKLGCRLICQRWKAQRPAEVAFKTPFGGPQPFASLCAVQAGELNQLVSVNLSAVVVYGPNKKKSSAWSGRGTTATGHDDDDLDRLELYSRTIELSRQANHRLVATLPIGSQLKTREG